MRPLIAFSMVLAFCLLLVMPAQAKFPPKIKEAVFDAYPPAEPHRALETAYEQPDPSKMKGFVVLEQGGIPAEQARFFISWQEYDYRGVVIHLEKDDKMTTRRGAPYTYLKRGDVMAVAGIKYFHRTVYLKLLSSDIYMPETKRKEKRHSRVTVMLGFRFPKKIMKEDNAKEVISAIEKWLRPFPNVKEAKAYAKEIKGEVGVAGEASKASQAGQASKVTASEEEQIKRLEEKIEATRKQLLEAEEEMRKMKEETGEEN